MTNTSPSSAEKPAAEVLQEFLKEKNIVLNIGIQKAHNKEGWYDVPVLTASFKPNE